MRQSPDIFLEAVSAMDIGRRDLQEDALATDFSHRGELSFAVLSDGMGGHAAGEVASKIVVTEVFSELKLQSGNLDYLRANLGDVLTAAARGANTCLRAHADTDPDTHGMGATLVAPVFLGTQLYWISIGDSPLFLFRDGQLRQLNEDHSLAPQIDLMADAGLISADMARFHPDRNCLTSVLAGDPIDKIDCPDAPLDLAAGDIILAASDGLQTLHNHEIEAILNACDGHSAHEVATALMRALDQRGREDQDNVSMVLIRVNDLAAMSVPRIDLPEPPADPDIADGPALGTGTTGPAE